MAENLSNEGPARPMVEIALLREAGSGEWRLDWAAFARDSFRMTVQPQGEKPVLARAFTPEFLKAIEPYLPEAGAGSQVLTSSVNLELTGLTLSRMRVLFTRTAPPLERMMIRFQQALGELQIILQPHLRNTDTSVQLMEEAAAMALLDLLHPCLDLAAVDIPELNDQQYIMIMERLIALQSRKEEIGLFALLLQRFLARREMPGAASPDPQRVPVHARYRLLGVETV